MDRIFKGELIVTNSITKENEVYDEASDDFSLPHKGGLYAWEIIKEIFESAELKIDVINGNICHIGAGDVWMEIKEDGTVEIGASSG